MTSDHRTHFNLLMLVFLWYSWLLCSIFVNMLIILVIYCRRLYIFHDMLYERIVGQLEVYMEAMASQITDMSIVQQLVDANSKGNINATRVTVVLLEGNLPMDDSPTPTPTPSPIPHKGSVMRKAFPCYEVIMKRVVCTKTSKAKSIKTLIPLTCLCPRKNYENCSVLQYHFDREWGVMT